MFLYIIKFYNIYSYACTLVIIHVQISRIVNHSRESKFREIVEYIMINLNLKNLKATKTYYTNK